MIIILYLYSVYYSLGGKVQLHKIREKIIVGAFFFILVITSLIVQPNTISRGAQIIDETESSYYTREYRVMGYDDNCSFFYPRPSVEILPSDAPFKDIWKKGLSLNMTTSRWPYAFSGNVDSDRNLEIIGMNNDEFFCIDDDGSILWKKKMPLRSMIHLVADPDKDGMVETYVEIKGTNETPVQVWLYDNLGKVLRKFFFRDKKGGLVYDADVQVCNIIDLDDDGRLELIAALHTAYDLYPRGILIMDYETGEVLNNFRCASHMTNLVIADVNSDGKKDIVFGATASMNGAIIPRTLTNDYNSYVFAIDAECKEIWRDKISHDWLNPIFSYPMLTCADVDGKEGPEIIIYMGTKQAGIDPDKGEVSILNGLNGDHISDYSVPYQWIRPAGQYDLDNDGHLEAIIQGDVLNDELDHLAIMDLVTGEIQKDITVRETEGEDSFIPAGINDINGDGKLEIIVCSTITGTVFVYTSELDLLWNCSTDNSGATALISDIIPGGVNEIVCIGKGISLLTLDVEMEIERSLPLEDVIYLLPGEEILFEVEVKNTGDTIWMVEYLLLQEFEDAKKIIRSEWALTPRPGQREKISFTWSPGDEFSEMNMTIRVNVTEFDKGLFKTYESMKWKTFVLNGQLLSSMYLIDWDCPEEVGGGEPFRVQGCLQCSQGKGLVGERFDIDKARRKLSILKVTISLDKRSDWKELPVAGGDFSFSFYAPQIDGTYQMNLSFSDQRNMYSYSESKNIHVIEKEKKSLLVDVGIYFAVFAVTLSVLVITSMILRKISKKGLIPFIPVFSRDLDVTEHELRNEILKLIERRPGKTPKQIMIELGVPNYNTVKHHVLMLESHEKIRILKDPKKPRLNLCYPIDYRSSDAEYLSEAMKGLIREIELNPGIKRKDLNRNWSYSKGYLTRCIDDLDEKGYIVQNHENGYLIKNVFNNKNNLK